MPNAASLEGFSLAELREAVGRLVGEVQRLQFDNGWIGDGRDPSIGVAVPNGGHNLPNIYARNPGADGASTTPFHIQRKFGHSGCCQIYKANPIITARLRRLRALMRRIGQPQSSVDAEGC